jgi:hypothetical protein
MGYVVLEEASSLRDNGSHKEKPLLWRHLLAWDVVVLLTIFAAVILTNVKALYVKEPHSAAITDVDGTFRIFANTLTELDCVLTLARWARWPHLFCRWLFLRRYHEHLP